MSLRSSAAILNQKKSFCHRVLNSLLREKFEVLSCQFDSYFCDQRRELIFQILWTSEGEKRFFSFGITEESLMMSDELGLSLSNLLRSRVKTLSQQPHTPAKKK